MTPISDNPYVGPRPFTQKEKNALYGRDREALELQRLITAERIVLLYSTSGAGKTSLVQAKLLPAFETEDFHILPPARVSGRQRADVAGTDINPYIASLISYWETSPDAKKAPLIDDLTDIDLEGYLNQRSWLQDDSKMKFLFLDQFEEILSLNPGDRQGKKVFFQQLGSAMKNRDRWVLIAMREEYIAGLDPYLHLLPTRLSTRYRLELLGREEASKAVMKPAEARGVTYHPDALKKLLDELTTVRDASGKSFQIDHVEPLHLQVVCNNLWTRIQDDMQKGKKEIQAKHVSESANVKKALAAYYRNTIEHVSQQAVAQQNNCSQRHIRDWFQQELVSSEGLRMPLQRSMDFTGSLPNPVVKMLEDYILVRATHHGEITFYEIAHDRLVAAIIEDNQQWYADQEKEFRVISMAAQKWSRLRREGRDAEAEKTLLSNHELAEASMWAIDNSQRLNKRDLAFLDACKKRRRDQQKLKSLYFGMKIFALLSLMVFLVFAGYLYWSNENLLAANRESISQRLISDAQRTRYRENNHELALLLATQARVFMGNRDASSAEQLLREVLQIRPFVLSPEMNTGTNDESLFYPMAFSSDGKTIAVQTLLNEITLRLLYPKNSEPSYSLTVENEILKLAFSPSGRYFVVVTNRGVEFFQPNPDSPRPYEMRLVTKLSTSSSPTGSFCLASWETVIFVATDGGNVEQWRFDGDKPQFLGNRGNWDSSFAKANSKVTSLACAPDGRWLAIGDAEGSIAKVAVSPLPSNPSLLKNEFGDWPKSMQDELSAYKAFLDLGVTQLIHWEGLKTGEWLLAVFRHGPIGLIRLSDRPKLFYLQPTDASAEELKIVAAQGQIVHQIVRKPKLFHAELDPSTNRLVVGGENSLIGIWQLETLFEDADAKKPVDKNAKLKGGSDRLFFAKYSELRGLGADIRGLAFTKEGSEIAAADSNANARIWLKDGLDRSPYRSCSVKISDQYPGAVCSVAMHPDGKKIIVGGSRYLSVTQCIKGTGQCLDSQNSDCLSASIRSLSVSPDKTFIAAATGEFQAVPACRPHKLPTNTVWLMDISKVAAGGPLPDPIVLDTDRADELWSVAWNASQNELAATSYDGKVWIWKRQKEVPSDSFTWVRQEPLTDIKSAPARTVAFHPHAPRLAVGRHDGSLEIWSLDVQADKKESYLFEKKTIPVSRSEVRAVAFSPDGDYLMAGTEDGRIRVFKTEGTELSEISNVRAHQAGVSAIAFHPEAQPAEPSGAAGARPGKWQLASSGNDGVVKIWERSSNAEGDFRIEEPPKLVLTGPKSEALSLSFSLEGDQIVAGDAMGRIHIWKLNHESLIDLACSSVKRNLSQNEWKRYVGEKIPYERTCPDLP